MLEWFTFGAAAVAALGAVAGPLIAYRAGTRRLVAEREAAAIANRQASVNRYIDQAVSANPVAASFAIAQLDYLLSTGDLTPEQSIAAYNAVSAALQQVETAVAAEEDPALDAAADNGGSTTGQEGTP